MRTDKDLESQIVALRNKGYSSRQVALMLLGRESRKSTVNDIYNRYLTREGRYALNECGEDGPNIFVFDIETSAAMVYAFARFDVNISQAQIVQEIMMLGVVGKWLGSNKNIEIYPRNFKNWDDPLEQYFMLSKIHQLLDKADIVVAHNGDRFDIKMLNAFFIRAGLPKPSPYRSVDTLKIAKRYFKFPSNSLDNLGEYLGLGRKVQHGGFSLWKGCMVGDTESFKKMIEYNHQDVDLLEAIYLKLRPWDHLHPNVSFHYEDFHTQSDQLCGVCGSSDMEDTGKMSFTNTMAYPLYKCNSCGAWHKMSQSIKLNQKPLTGVNK